MKETANSIHCFHLKNFGGPKWRKQETQFRSFHLKILEAQRERNTKPNSLVITAKFWRPKVKGTGISIHYFLSEKFWNRTKAKKTKNSIHHFSRQNFWGAKCRKQETQFASSHFKKLKAQSQGNRKLSSLIFTSTVLEAQNEGNRGLHSLPFIKILEAQSEGNRQITSSRLKIFGGPNWRKQETNFTSSSHLELLQAQSEGNRKLNSLVFTSK